MNPPQQHGASPVQLLPDESLLERSVAVLRARFGIADWLVIPGVQTARKSSVVRLRSPGSGRCAALKHYHDAAAARLQAAALRNTRPLLDCSGSGFDVPELYACFEQENALLVEWIDARHLEQVLVRAALQPAAHWRAVMLAGSWLRRFHESSGIAQEPFDAQRHRKLLATRIAAAPAALALLSADPLWIAALRCFEQQAPVLEGRPVSSALTHGDFSSTNLLLGAGRVSGIDLWAQRRAPAVDDLARMFVYLAMGDPLPFTARLRPVPLAARRAMQALFEGYGADLAAELDREVWRHVVLYETLARWIALSSRLAQRASFTESWKRGGLRALVRTILDDRDAPRAPEATYLTTRADNA